MAELTLGILISGRGSNLQALIDAAAEPHFPARIGLVISNEPDAAGLKRAKEAGLATRVVDHRRHDSREAFEAQLHADLTEAGAELICLAGFMRILTSGFVERWAGRIINIHPSLLPAFKGLHVHERVIEAGVRFTGCTVHFVTPDMDSGPIIVQAAVPVLNDDTPETLAARVLEQEHLCYPRAVRLVAEGRVRIVGNRTEITDAEGPAEALINPLG